MNPGRAFSAANHFRDLLVRQSLLHPQRENLALCRRKSDQRSSNSLLRFLSDERIERAVFADVVRLFNGYRFPAPSLSPPSIEHQSPLDGEEPGSQRAFAPKRIERRESPDERVLYQLLDSIPLARARREPRQCLRMPTNQARGRSRIPALPALDKLQIGLFSSVFGPWNHGASSSRRPGIPLVKGN